MKQKIKIYKMPLSEYFPKTHKRAGDWFEKNDITGNFAVIHFTKFRY